MPASTSFQFTFPLERAADLPSLNPVELLHIDPRDVQLGFASKKAEDKLAGDV